MSGLHTRRNPHVLWFWDALCALGGHWDPPSLPASFARNPHRSRELGEDFEGEEEEDDSEDLEALAGDMDGDVGFSDLFEALEEVRRGVLYGLGSASTPCTCILMAHTAVKLLSSLAAYQTPRAALGMLWATL